MPEVQKVYFASCDLVVKQPFSSGWSRASALRLKTSTKECFFTQPQSSSLLLEVLSLATGSLLWISSVRQQHNS